MATDTDTNTHVHKADPSNPGFCRKCGEPMPGSEGTIAAAFEAAPVAGPPSTGLACLRCGAVLSEGSACCEACGLTVTWTGSQPHQEMADVRPTPTPTAPASIGHLKVVVRVNRDIHDRTAHP